jgi:hypothetical protein
VVVLAGNDGLARVVRASAWSSARCLDLGACGVSHEALSGSALALGAELVFCGTKEVLIVAGGKGTRFVTRLEAMGNAA